MKATLQFPLIKPVHTQHFWLKNKRAFALQDEPQRNWLHQLKSFLNVNVTLASKCFEQSCCFFFPVVFASELSWNILSSQMRAITVINSRFQQYPHFQQCRCEWWDVCIYLLSHKEHFFLLESLHWTYSPWQHQTPDRESVSAATVRSLSWFYVIFLSLV